MKSKHGWNLIEVQPGREPADVDSFSIKVDGSLDDDILQQQIHNVSRQREELQRMEVELRAQAIARPRILDMQSSCDAEIEAHANATAKLEVCFRMWFIVLLFWTSTFRENK